MSEEILAWRGWELVGWDDAVRREGGFVNPDENWVRLKSISRIFLWDGPSVTADQKPSVHSAHGLYAMVSRDRFTAQVAGAHVIGQVALSGIVIEGSNGYRAERATIRSLIILRNPFPDVPLIVLADRLASFYQCEVTWEIKEPKKDDPNTLMLMQLATQASLANAFPVGAHQQGQYLTWPSGLGSGSTQGLGIPGPGFQNAGGNPGVPLGLPPSSP